MAPRRPPPRPRDAPGLWPSAHPGCCPASGRNNEPKDARSPITFYGGRCPYKTREVKNFLSGPLFAVSELYSYYLPSSGEKRIKREEVSSLPHDRRRMVSTPRDILLQCRRERRVRREEEEPKSLAARTSVGPVRTCLLRFSLTEAPRSSTLATTKPRVTKPAVIRSRKSPSLQLQTNAT